EIGHQNERQGEYDGNAGKADAAHLHDVAQHKSNPEQNDAGLKPEFVSFHTGTKDPGDAHGIGDDQSEDDGPKHVLDIGQEDMMASSIAGNRLLGQFASVTKNGKKENAGNQAETFPNRNYHGIPLRIPTLINKTARSETSAAHQSIPRVGLLG